MSDNHTKALIQQLPRGERWWGKLTAPGKWLYEVLAAMAIELQRLDDKAEALRLEAIPANATTTLTRWEEFEALPDKLNPVLGSFEQRRVTAQDYLTDEDILTKQQLIDRAAELGFEITIDEPCADVRPCGVLICGQRMSQESQRFIVKINILNAISGLSGRLGILQCGQPMGSKSTNQVEALCRWHILEHYEIVFNIL